MREQCRFLSGYTQGGQAGEKISIFLCHSPFPWTISCIEAIACEWIDAGEVIVVSSDLPWSLLGEWYAYRPHRKFQI